MQTRPRALLSVYDKTDLIPFARTLHALGYHLIASGGTQRTLAASGIDCTPISDITGAPEILEGRVKTLHPIIHGGILARPSHAHRAELALHNIQAIDVVVCNLYPFAQAAADPQLSEAAVLDQLDVGGVTLLRAAAKNFDRVTVVCDPQDYPRALDALQGLEAASTRRALALKAFQHTATYDAQIAAWFARSVHPEAALPDALHLALERVQTLRYGENPHQRGALYRAIGQPPAFEPLQGKTLSFNNLADLDAAWGVVAELEPGAVAVVKHLTPCGVAQAPRLEDALRRAVAADPVSAFGSIVAANAPVDRPFIEALGDLFVEVIAAPAFTPEALEDLSADRPRCRAVLVDPEAPVGLQLRAVRGGFLAQTPDADAHDPTTWEIPTRRQPTDAERVSLALAWRIVRHVRSNAIVLVREQATVGIGGGDTSRLDATRAALRRAGERAQGAALASDAFFPFPDAVEEAAAAGVTAIIQPGGSIRDREVIEAADRLGLAMICTHRRHFRH